jgi:hypothetical protein
MNDFVRESRPASNAASPDVAFRPEGQGLRLYRLTLTYVRNVLAEPTRSPTDADSKLISESAIA